MFVASPALLWLESRRRRAAPRAATTPARWQPPRRAPGLIRANGPFTGPQAPPSGPVGAPRRPRSIPATSAGDREIPRGRAFLDGSGPLSHNPADPFPMRALIGLVVLGTLFVMAASWQSRMTSELRRDRSQRYNVADDSAPGQEGWSRLVLGRPSGADPLLVVESVAPTTTFSPQVVPRRGARPEPAPYRGDRVHGSDRAGPRQDLSGALRRAPAGRGRGAKWRPTTNSPAPTTSVRARAPAPGPRLPLQRARATRASAPGLAESQRDSTSRRVTSRMRADPSRLPPSATSSARASFARPGLTVLQVDTRECATRAHATRSSAATARSSSSKRAGASSRKASTSSEASARLVVEERCEHAVVQHAGDPRRARRGRAPHSRPPAPPPRASGLGALIVPAAASTGKEAITSARVTRGRDERHRRPPSHEPALQPLHQPMGLERLGEEVVHPPRCRSGDVRQERSRSSPGSAPGPLGTFSSRMRRVASYPSAEHLAVHEDRVVVPHRERVDGAAAVARDVHSIAPLPEHVLDELLVGVVVLDEGMQSRLRRSLSNRCAGSHLRARGPSPSPRLRREHPAQHGLDVGPGSGGRDRGDRLVAGSLSARPATGGVSRTPGRPRPRWTPPRRGHPDPRAARRAGLHRAVPGPWIRSPRRCWPRRAPRLRGSRGCARGSASSPPRHPRRGSRAPAGEHGVRSRARRIHRAPARRWRGAAAG